MYKFTIILCCCFSLQLHAQTGLSLQECEYRFLKNNLVLLAEQYNIDAAHAQVVQARLWENPYFTADLNAINPEREKALDIRRNGQKAFAIEQLIYLGGKKKFEVALARTNAEAAELAFTDLTRNLRFQLRTSFFNVYYNQEAITILEQQLTRLDTLILSYSEQVQRGNLPLKDLVRLQSLAMTLQNDRTSILNDIIENQQRLSLLLASDSIFTPRPTAQEVGRYQTPLTASVEELQQTALTHRADYLLAAKNQESAQWNVKWQKALAVPDVTVGAAYDQRGGAFNNQVNLTLGLPLRLWNKNQGNIRAAEAKATAVATQLTGTRTGLLNEVTTAYRKYSTAKQHYESLSTAQRQNFEAVYDGVLKNFQRRNISLIEFTDFMESYNQSLLQFSQVQKALAFACEEINFTTGSIHF